MIMKGSKQRKSVVLYLCVLFTLASLFACRHEYLNLPIGDVQSANATPIASIVGGDRKAALGTTVIISGADSSDIENQALFYSWKVIDPEGELYPLDSPNTEQIIVIPVKAGQYRVFLKVSDGREESGEDLVHIVANNNMPVAIPVYSGIEAVGNTITLDGSKSSAEDAGQILTYQWELTFKPDESQTFISDPSAASPTLLLDVQGWYLIHLIVSDGFQRSHSEPRLIKAGPPIFTNPGTPNPRPPKSTTPPVAKAGKDIILMRTDVPYALDGSSSYDPKDLPLSFQWDILSKPAGSIAELTNASDPQPEVNPDVRGSYVIQLTVTNSVNLKHSDTVVITDKRLGLFCADCHNEDNAGGPAHHPMSVRHVYSDCGRCHRIGTWEVGPAVPGSDFFDELTRGTRRVFSGLIGNHEGIVSRCSECHLSDLKDAALTHPTTSNRCNACHNTTGWLSKLTLEHTRALGQCVDCHTRDKPSTHIQTINDCNLCHDKTDWALIIADPHGTQGSDCVQCHDVDLKQFHGTHDTFSDQCGPECHTVNNWTENKNNRFETIGDCLYCHNGNTFPGKPDNHLPVSNQCHQCHTLLEWSPAYQFNHQETEAKCITCHPNQGPGAP